MQERTKVAVSLLIALSLNLIVVGWHYAPYWTNLFCTYVAIAAFVWFFFLIFRSLFRKLHAQA
jgi:hypothetical protein